ncbi:hypothetical protein BC936DRAFT_140572 [Jimgerdemannia flammicorona]|uniref:Chromo domain-containing protein n=1 Tax=Jimgerdemannia flammicorona TaxID=994334 RepID=A0A433AMJ4_9FUNG|nr:hypothetical protein BC936DRAFT_140572 [Jimgerdemannia flammicorona]
MEDTPPTARSETNDAEQQKAADKSAENGEDTMEEEKGAKAEEDGENEEEGEERWEVEKITNHTACKGVVKYWVKWIGYSEDENTWEPHTKMMEDAPEAVGEYWKSIKNGKEICAKLFGTSGKGAKNNDVASSNKRRKTSETAVWNMAASHKAVKEAPSNSSGMQKSN